MVDDVTVKTATTQNIQGQQSSSIYDFSESSIESFDVILDELASSGSGSEYLPSEDGEDSDARSEVSGIVTEENVSRSSIKN